MIEGYEYHQTHDTLNPRVAMATTASVMGLISIALLLSVYFAIILGGIAIVMAILSRSAEGKFLPQAKRGLIFGSIGLIGGYFIMVQAMVSVFTDAETRAMVNQYTESISGESFDEMLIEIQKNLGITIK